MPIITIDGNIGCYKTSILNYFHKNYKLAIDLEPVDNWTDYLANLYNTTNSSYDFQIKVWVDRCWIQEKTSTTVLMERSPYFIKNVFVRKAFEDKTISEMEYENIISLHKTTDELWKPNGYIYLRSAPDKCLQRIIKRGRSTEKNIKLEYIHKLHELHENNYKLAQENNMNIIVIDIENKSISDICSEILSSNLYNDIVFNI
jgi:deoxyadenosine/deoxycytidine kinase